MVDTSQSPPDAQIRPQFRVPVLFWMVIAAILFSGVTIGLSLWVPRLQRQRSIARIERMGGVVFSERSRSLDLPRLISGRTRRILAIDLSGADLTDADLASLTEFEDVRQLLISGPKLTDSGLDHLASLEDLETLVLVNCPQVSKRGEQALLEVNPALKISRRGAALLGIVGSAHTYGCRIHSVRPESAAAKSGLMRGDIIVRFDGERVGGFETLTQLIAGRKPGDRVPIVAIRRGRRVQISTVLGKWGAAVAAN